MSRRAARGIGLALAVLAAASGVWWLRVAGRPKYPGESWSWKAPEKAGFSAEKLAAFSARVGGDGCLVHGGEMIHAWGDIDQRRNVASSIKPIYAFLTYKAIEIGRLDSLDDLVVNWVPELDDLNAAAEYKDREITFRHLLEQTSGYGLEEKPGESFAYNDYATGLLVWALFYRVYDRPPKEYDDVLNGELLGAVLGFEDEPTAISFRVPRGRIRISARDMARFALLYLRGGSWQGRRFLREDLFREALRPPLPDDFPRTSGEEAELLEQVVSIGGGKDEKHHAGSLGHFWWHNDRTPDGNWLLPDAPPETFLGVGYGGRSAMVVIPELDLVAVWHDAYLRTGEAWSPFSDVGRFKVNDLLRDLLAARAEVER
jgi:CubicO group peptidase (beta-lactamase class C family)